METTIDGLTVVVLIEDVSNAGGLTVSGMNTADAYIGLMGMGIDTELPFMPRRRLSMLHRHRRRVSLFFSPPSLFAEERDFILLKVEPP